jgi:hypothetical protein
MVSKLADIVGEIWRHNQSKRVDPIAAAAEAVVGWVHHVLGGVDADRGLIFRLDQNVHTSAHSKAKKLPSFLVQGVFEVTGEFTGAFTVDYMHLGVQLLEWRSTPGTGVVIEEFDRQTEDFRDLVASRVKKDLDAEEMAGIESRARSVKTFGEFIRAKWLNYITEPRVSCYRASGSDGEVGPWYFGPFSIEFDTRVRAPRKRLLSITIDGADGIITGLTDRELFTIVAGAIGCDLLNYDVVQIADVECAERFNALFEIDTLTNTIIPTSPEMSDRGLADLVGDKIRTDTTKTGTNYLNKSSSRTVARGLVDGVREFMEDKHFKKFLSLYRPDDSAPQVFAEIEQGPCGDILYLTWQWSILLSHIHHQIRGYHGFTDDDVIINDIALALERYNLRLFSRNNKFDELIIEVGDGFKLKDEE